MTKKCYIIGIKSQTINKQITCIICLFLDGQKREHDGDEEYQGRKRQRGEGNRVDLRVLLQSKVCFHVILCSHALSNTS